MRYGIIALAILTAVLAAGCSNNRENAAGGVSDNAGNTSEPMNAVTNILHGDLGGDITIIDIEKAIAIAIEHAGAENADITKREYDYNRGNPEYEVEFISDGVKYEYEIDAVNGNVLDFSSETFSPAADTAVSENGIITREAAESIAIKNAGLTVDQVTFMRSEKDVENGITIYEVKFKYGGYEYGYEINAASGEIIKADIDVDN